MKKIVFTLGLVTLMSIGASAQNATTTTADKAKVEKKCCANKKSCKKTKTAAKEVTTSTSNGTAKAQVKTCSKKKGKCCKKAAETSSTK